MEVTLRRNMSVIFAGRKAPFIRTINVQINVLVVNITPAMIMNVVPVGRKVSFIRTSIVRINAIAVMVTIIPVKITSALFAGRKVSLTFL